MTHGHGQWCGDGLWDLGGGLEGGRQRGEMGTTVIEKQ